MAPLFFFAKYVQFEKTGWLGVPSPIIGRG